MFDVHIIWVAASTVFKLVGAVTAGIFLSPHLSEASKSEVGFSYIAVRIMLSCMLFGNLCLDISTDFMSRYYWAVIMSIIPMILGALLSFAAFPLVSREYRVMVLLGSTFQNGLLFPLSVVTNIRGIAWLDDKTVLECQQYVFLYNLSTAMCLWSIGGAMIKHYKDKFAAEKEDAAEEAYYERRKRHTLKKFMHEIQQRVHRRAMLSSPSADPQPQPQPPSQDPPAEQPPDSRAVPAAPATATAVSDPGSPTAPSSKASPAGSPTAANPTAALCANILAGYRKTFMQAAAPDSPVAAAGDLVPAAAAGGTGELAPAEQLLDANASPTVRGQLRWYRPAPRSARPIDVAKFDRWKEMSHAQRAATPTPSGVAFAGAQTEDYFVVENIYTDHDVPAESPQGMQREKDEQQRERVAESEHAAMAAQQEAIARGEAMPSYSDFTTLGLSPPSTPPPGASDDVFVRNRDHLCNYRLRQLKAFFWFAIQMPPIFMTLLAIAISTIPPLRWCATTYVGLSVVKGIALVGTGCVPFQLVALGCTLASKKQETAPLALRDNLDSESAEDDAAAKDGVQATAPTTAVAGASKKTPAPSAPTADAMLAASPAFDVDSAFPIPRERAADDGSHEADGRGDADAEGDTRQPASPNTARVQKLQETKKKEKFIRRLARRERREMLKAMGAVRRFWFRMPDATRFSIIAIFLRLLILPAISFAIVHWFIQLRILPLDRPFIVSILIGISSPTAVNASLVCTINNYHPREFSRMIFVMYCLAAVTSTLWLYLSITYTSSYVPATPSLPFPEDM